MSKEIREHARLAKEKKAPLGDDVNIEDYIVKTREHQPITSLGEIDEEYKQDLFDAGIEPSEKERSGSFLQHDRSVVFSMAHQKGLEVMSITAALAKYDWLKDYLWKAVPVDVDKYTAEVELAPSQGYFIRSKAGSRITLPVQACLFMTANKIRQNVHNIIIAEEDSELHIITGCSVYHAVNSAFHIGVSEIYVKRGAKITFTMVHNWKSGMDVRPRTVAMVEDDGIFINNYILMKPVKSLQMYPTAYCLGKNARANFQSVIFASNNSRIDLGSRAVLQGEGSRSEIISRATATDNAKIIARGDISGSAEHIRGHLECRGLMLSDTASIAAIPELEARRRDLDLSHEAAVGKISQEEIQYLMSRGLSEEEATSVLIRGFLNVDITGLPDALAKETKRIFDMSLESAV